MGGWGVAVPGEDYAEAQGDRQQQHKDQGERGQLQRLGDSQPVPALGHFPHDAGSQPSRLDSHLLPARRGL